MPIFGRKGCIYRVGIRVRGVWRGFRASDFDPTVRGGGRLGEGLVGCVECIGLIRERGPTAASETETSDEGTGSGTAMFNGWAVKLTPNATKLDRRSVYTIIRPHAKLQPIPRTFFGHS